MDDGDKLVRFTLKRNVLLIHDTTRQTASLCTSMAMNCRCHISIVFLEETTYLYEDTGEEIETRDRNENCLEKSAGQHRCRVINFDVLSGLCRPIVIIINHPIKYEIREKKNTEHGKALSE